MDSLDAVVQERMVVAKEQQKSKRMTLLSKLVEIDMSQVLQNEISDWSSRKIGLNIFLLSYFIMIILQKCS